MSYDCSITKRKGCNYCVRGKSLPYKDGLSAYVNDDDCNGKAEIVVRNSIDGIRVTAINCIKINYCPICGKKLMGQ